MRKLRVLARLAAPMEWSKKLRGTCSFCPEFARAPAERFPK
jgi:hypothetical protein